MCEIEIALKIQTPNLAKIIHNQKRDVKKLVTDINDWDLIYNNGKQ